MGPAPTLLEPIRHHASNSPQRPFLLDLDSGISRTYADGWRDAGRVAAGLRRMGVEDGDRVVLRLTNSWAFVAALLGALRTGAVVVPTVRQYALDELSFIVEDCAARWVVAEDHDVVAETLGDSATVVSVDAAGARPSLAELVADTSADEPPDAPGVGSDALILYTSGTTSRPKGVVISHSAAVSAALVNAEDWRIREDDRSYLVLPLFHCNALFMQFLPAAYSGALTVLTARFSASSYLATARTHRITLGNLTAGAIRSVMRQPPTAGDRDHDLRMMSFGLPLGDSEIEEFEQRYGVPLYMGYGLTESCAGGTRTPSYIDGRRGWQSLGVPQRGWSVKIVSDEGERLSPGSTGEIALQGPALLDRYWGRPDDSAIVKRDGWLYTGDLGMLDADGYLHFVSRKKDMLKPKGENVAASEIELALEAHAGVAEAAVVGVFDPHHEELVVAFAVPAAGTPPGEDELRDFCAARLARFKVPSRFLFLDELPKTSIGKVNKARLLERLD